MCKGNYVFQPGDVVRRKAEQLDSLWCTCMRKAGKSPDADLEVAWVSGVTTSISFAGDALSWGWESGYFDLVRRASPPVQDSVAVAITADAILGNAAAEMQDRAASRDTPEGERSMGRCVKAFNAMFGTELTETQGWQFMELLKMARSVGGEFRLDDFTDGVAYAALAGESEARLKQSV